MAHYIGILIVRSIIAGGEIKNTGMYVYIYIYSQDILSD